jgi:thiol-disulfide isomerase/thioredoxin
VVAVLAGVALLALVIAIVATRGTSDGGGSGIEQTRPVTVSGAALPQLPDSGTDPAVGRAAPVLRGAAFDGTTVDIGGDARPKIIVFAAHWCPHCRAEIPVIESWLDAVGRPTAVDLYAVSTAVNRAGPNYPPSDWLENWPVTTLADSSDGAAAGAFGVNAYPFFVVVRANGTVALRVTGELTPAQLTSLVETART